LVEKKFNDPREFARIQKNQKKVRKKFYGYQKNPKDLYQF